MDENLHIAKRIFSPETSHRSFKLENGNGHVTVPVPMIDQLKIVRRDDVKVKNSRDKRQAKGAKNEDKHVHLKPDQPEDLSKFSVINVGVFLDAKLMDDMGKFPTTANILINMLFS